MAAERACPVCGNHHHFSSRRDSCFCEPCDEWAEKKCSDGECVYCKDRPTRPSMDKSLLKIKEESTAYV